MRGRSEPSETEWYRSPCTISPRNRFIDGEPKKSATKVVDRIRIDFHRRADLHDLARAHDHDPVGERHRLFLVVRDEDEGALERLMQPVAFGAQFASQLGIEARQRFVEQERRWVGHQRAGERDPLRLAARALARHLVEQVRDAHHLGDLAHALLPAPPGARFFMRRPNSMFCATFLCGNSAWVWNTMPRPRSRGSRSLTTRPSMRISPAVGSSKPAIMRKRRGLAAARRPDQHDELAVLDGQAQILHRRHGAEGLAQADELDAGHGYLRTIPKLKPRARCLRMMSPTIISGIVMPTASAAWRP